MPSNAADIANRTAGIGATLAQGRVAGAQTDVAAQNQLFEDALGIGKAGLTGFDVGGFSDIRLKTNIKPAGQRNGYNWYTWDWNKEAGALGLVGAGEGVMAHEVREIKPELVGEKDGYITVNYAGIE